MHILGIETSCDETSCAIVRDGCEVRSNVIASQVDLHASYGGVVPEIASRAHIQKILPVLERALADAAMPLDGIDALAVTIGPGLIGSLLVGVETAKALSFAKAIPLVPINHIASHLYAPFLSDAQGKSRIEIMNAARNDQSSKSRNSTSGQRNISTSSGRISSFPHAQLRYPYLGMVVSGGHSSLVIVREPLRYEVVGVTLDDAAGEAYDKVAKLLGLGYPGGPIIDRLAQEGDAAYVRFPRPRIRAKDFNLSFSGLKTAVMQYVRETGYERIVRDPTLVRHVVASFQAAVIDSLLTKAERALSSFHLDQLAIVGGVAANRALRAQALQRLAGVHVVVPPAILCTDNAAMVAGLALHHFRARRFASLSLNAQADCPLNG
jgi:N6-L-threonylcarbamoyladenine synthase